jgi:predicted ATPase
MIGIIACALYGACGSINSTMRLQQGRRLDARRLLAPVSEKFTENFRGEDLRSARALLDTLPAG